jgi:transcriptional regulator with XRE-family HTH domain
MDGRSRGARPAGIGKAARASNRAPDRDRRDPPASLGACDGECPAAIGLAGRVALAAEHGLRFDTAVARDRPVAVAARRDVHGAHVRKAAAHRAHAPEGAGGAGWLLEAVRKLSSNLRRGGGVGGLFIHVAFLVAVERPTDGPGCARPPAPRSARDLRCGTEIGSHGTTTVPKKRYNDGRKTSRIASKTLFAMLKKNGKNSETDAASCMKEFGGYLRARRGVDPPHLREAIRANRRKRLDTATRSFSVGTDDLMPRSFQAKQQLARRLNVPMHTLRDLAEQMGMSKNTLHDYETGKRYPSAEFVFDFCAALRMDADPVLTHWAFLHPNPNVSKHGHFGRFNRQLRHVPGDPLGYRRSNAFEFFVRAIALAIPMTGLPKPNMPAVKLIADAAAMLIDRALAQGYGPLPDAIGLIIDEAYDHDEHLEKLGFSTTEDPPEAVAQPTARPGRALPGERAETGGRGAEGMFPTMKARERNREPTAASRMKVFGRCLRSWRAVDRAALRQAIVVNRSKRPGTPTRSFGNGVDGPTPSSFRAKQQLARRLSVPVHTLRELAEQMGMSKNTLHEYETGKRYPPAEFVFDFCAALQIEVHPVLTQWVHCHRNPNVRKHERFGHFRRHLRHRPGDPLGYQPSRSSAFIRRAIFFAFPLIGLQSLSPTHVASIAELAATLIDRALAQGYGPLADAIDVIVDQEYGRGDLLAWLGSSRTENLPA